MSYRIREGESVAKGVRRLAREQIDKAVGELSDPELHVYKSVHQARKRMKKIRAALRLVRGALGGTYSDENAFYRDAGRRLAAARDAEALIETYAGLRELFADQLRTERFDRIADALVRRRDDVAVDSDLDVAVSEVIDSLRAARKRVKSWPIEGEGFDPAEDGLVRTYKRGRKAMRGLEDAGDSPDEADADAGHHEWRKRAKYHRYHLRILQDMWPRVLKARRKEMHRLTDLLGDDHDLTVLRGVMRDEPDWFGDRRDAQVVAGLIGRRQAELRARARTLGERLYAESPQDFGGRMRACWDAWQAEQNRPVAVPAS